jgi:ribosome-associated protein
MDIHSLQAIVIDALEDIKAQDIKLFDTMPLTSLFDRVAIVSGTSNRQTRALAAHVRDKVKQAGGQVISVEGEETGEWVLVDLGDMVIHVMQPTIRSYYNLEELWGEYPIDYKATKKTISRRSASVAEPALTHEDVSAKAPIARKASAKKPAYEKGGSTKSKASKGGVAPAKTATGTARKAKVEPRSDALESADFSAVGAVKVAPKTLPWRAAADKPAKIAAKSTGAKSGVKSPLKAAAKKAPGSKLAAKKAAPKTSPLKPAPAKKSLAKK